ESCALRRADSKWGSSGTGMCRETNFTALSIKGRSSSPCYRPPSVRPGQHVWCLIERYVAHGYLLKLYGGQRVIEKRGFVENICPDYLLSENAYFPIGSDPIPIQ